MRNVGGDLQNLSDLSDFSFDLFSKWFIFLDETFLFSFISFKEFKVIFVLEIGIGASKSLEQALFCNSIMSVHNHIIKCISMKFCTIFFVYLLNEPTSP